MGVSDGITCRVYDYKTGCNPPFNIQPAAQTNPSINDLFSAAFDRKTGKVRDKAARDKLNRELSKPTSNVCSLDNKNDMDRIIIERLNNPVLDKVFYIMRCSLLPRSMVQRTKSMFLKC